MSIDQDDADWLADRLDELRAEIDAINQRHTNLLYAALSMLGTAALWLLQHFAPQVIGS